MSNCFDIFTDLLYANTGDRIWWVWDIQEVSEAFTILETEACLSPIGKRANIEADVKGKQKLLMQSIKISKRSCI